MRVQKRRRREQKLLAHLMLLLLHNRGSHSEVILHPRGHLANWGGAATGISWAEAKHSAKPPTWYLTAPQNRELSNTKCQSAVPSLGNPAPPPSPREGHFVAVTTKSTSLSSCCPVTNRGPIVCLRNVWGGLAKGSGTQRKTKAGLGPSWPRESLPPTGLA